MISGRCDMRDGVLGSAAAQGSLEHLGRFLKSEKVQFIQKIDKM